MDLVIVILIVVGIGCGVGYFLISRWEKSPEGQAKMRQYEAQKRALDEKIKCPHCDTAGFVTTADTHQKSGISGGKATGAVLTGGLSMLATGLSREQSGKTCTCSNCGMTWFVPGV